MEFSMENLCNSFKCYDTGVKQISLNTTAQSYLRKMGFYSDVIHVKAFLKMIPMTLFLSICMFGQIGHLIHYLRSNPYNFFEVADDISTIVSTAIVIPVVISLGSRGPELTKLFLHLGQFDDHIQGRAPTVEALSKLFGKYVNCCAGFLASMCMFTFIYYFLDKCEPGEVSSCGFIYIPYLPYINIYNKPSRQIYLLFQCLSPYSGGFLIIIMKSQYIFAIEILILKYAHLQDIIKRMPTTKPCARRALLRRIVQYHNFLLEYKFELAAEAQLLTYDCRVNVKINSAVSRPFTVHLTVTPIAMSMILYQIFGKGATLPTVLHLLIYMFLTSLTCCSGERLTTNAAKIYDAIFYAIPTDDLIIAKDMKLLLLQAKKPVAIVAGSVSPMSHTLMNEIYKTVWSVLTLIKQTK